MTRSPLWDPAERPQATAAALLFILASLELWLRSNVLFGSAALYHRDLFLLYYPLVQTVLRALSEGALPVRDPSSAFGQPLLGDPSCQILYPPVLVHLLLPPHLAYAWFVSLHSIFGALGVGLLARRMAGGSWFAAFVAGLFWLVGGPLQSLATLWHHMAGASWIPWVLLGVLRLSAVPARRSILLLGAAFGAQILAGSADMCAMTALLAVPFALLGSGWRLWRQWLASAALALALGAGAWLPAVELVLTSARSTLPEAMRTGWSLHPLSIIEIFLPVPMSDLPLLPRWRAVMFEGKGAFLGSLFLGPTILPLVLAAWSDARIARGLRLASGFGVVGGLLVALGKHAAFYSVAVTLLPPLRILRFPTKGMIPVSILLCVLAGVGAASLSQSRRSRIAALCGVVIVAVFGLAFWGLFFDRFVGVMLDQIDSQLISGIRASLSKGILFSVALLIGLAACLGTRLTMPSKFIAAAVILGSLLQGAALQKELNPTVPPEVLAYKPPHLELARPTSDGRVYVYDYGLYQGIARKHLGRDEIWDLGKLGPMSPHVATVIAGHSTLTPLTAAFWGFEYAWDGNFRLLFDSRLARLTENLTSLEGTPGFLRLLQISGVERVVSLHEKGMEELRVMSRQHVFDTDDLRIFEVPNPLPRALITTGRKRGTGADLVDLMDSGFDPRSSVLVDQGDARGALVDPSSSARITERRPDHLTIETTSSVPAFLTVLEGYMSGWRVSVDGKTAKVERANALFIGTEIPAGTHRVEFRFLPITAIVGVLSTLLTALALLVKFVKS